MTSQDRTYAETFCLRKNLQNLKLAFKDCKVSGEELILIFDFHALLDEDNTLDVSDVQLMVLLPHSLSVSTGDQYRAAANSLRSGRTGGIVQWPYDVQHLFRTYETEVAVGETIDDFLHVLQNDKETANAALLNTAAYPCGIFKTKMKRSLECY